MAHLLAESAEMRRDEEIAVDAGRRADRAGIEKAPDAPDVGDVAAVLHDGMTAMRLSRRRDDRVRVLAAVGERLLGQKMAAVLEGRKRQVAPRRRHRDVEDDIGLGLVEHRVEIAADGDAVRGRIPSPALRRASTSRSTSPADRHAVDLPRSLEPRFAHGSASDQDGLHQSRPLPA